MTPTLKQIEDTARAATQGEWVYSPNKKTDDWGYIRSADGYMVAVARAGGPVIEDDHRMRGTDPYGPNAAHIAMMSPQRTLELVADLRAAAEALEDVRVAAFEHGNKGLSGKTLDPTGGITGAVLAALQNLKRWGI